jgi:hypothetical protein
VHFIFRENFNCYKRKEKSWLAPHTFKVDSIDELFAGLSAILVAWCALAHHRITLMQPVRHARQCTAPYGQGASAAH